MPHHTLYLTFGEHTMNWKWIGLFSLPFFIAMMVIHELGHIIAVKAMGATLVEVTWFPLSYTHFEDAKSPAFIVWSGPVFGVVVPAALALGMIKSRWSHWFGAFTGFCFVANGVYLSFGILENVGDVGALVSYGTSPWLIGIIGAAMLVVGFLIWHYQGLAIKKAHLENGCSGRLRHD